jgi:hypothetical protein
MAPVSLPSLGAMTDRFPPSRPFGVPDEADEGNRDPGADEGLDLDHLLWTDEAASAAPAGGRAPQDGEPSRRREATRSAQPPT